MLALGRYRRAAYCVLAAWLLAVAGGAMAWAGSGPVRVEVVQRDGAWQLLRGGEPYVIQGAGGSTGLDLLAASGANGFRTWGADDIGPLLDRADSLGLAVTVGFWMGQEQQGFDYSDPQQVARQVERAREAILRYKDHPAVLAWGLGNEMEGFKDGGDPAVWAAVDSLGALAHRLDPDHPTMTVMAELGGKRMESVHRYCPNIDIVGINSYGGAASIPGRYRSLGGTKPYVVCEYGPPGTWEIGRNAWGAAEELSSTEKAGFYRRAYDAFTADSGLCLGSYAFLWGWKPEATPTWYGMLLPDGSRLAAVDALTEAWSGRPPANRCPVVERLALRGPGEVAPGARVRAELAASDPEGDALQAAWVLMRDASQYETGGVDQAALPSFPRAIERVDAGGADLRMPTGGGRYRLFVYLRDGHGGAATANVPLRVQGPDSPIEAVAAGLPLLLVGDGARPGYVPSGWMGEIKSLTMDETCADRPHGGATCTRFDYTYEGGWVGVAWQSPAQDWGDLPGGYDLTGAKRLTFWARGERGGERVKFGFGLLGPEKKYGDSARGETEVTLTREWKQYSIGLGRKSLRRIKTGFLWTLAGQGRPVTFYLDDVRYE
jgi:hypothetical protein